MNNEELAESLSVVGCAATVVFALFAPALAHATVYKCQGEQGVVQYQESPCLIGRELRNFDSDPPPLSVVPRLADPSAEAAPMARMAPDPVPAAKPAPASRIAAVPAHAPTTAKGGDPSARRFIREGMTEGDVLAAIGPPDATASNNGKSRGNGRWSYLPTAGDPDTVTTITFASGTVSAVSRKVIRK